MYIVYTEILADTIERYYYGTYTTEERANEVAYSLGGEFPTYYCVCKVEEAEDWGVKNLPNQ